VKIKSLKMFWKVAPGGGIEPPTRGFSIEAVVDCYLIITT